MRKTQIFTKTKLALISGLLFTPVLFAQNVPAAKGLVNAKAVATQSVAPKAPPVIPYTGTTLDKIRSTGKIVIGVRASSIPLSYIVNKQPIGYGVDICNDIVNTIKTNYNLPNLQTEYVEVTGDNRVPYTVSGKVDLECGSTTNNASRRKDVDFSVTYYISGVRILTKNNSGIHVLNDLRGKRVSLGSGTTSVPLVDKFNKERAMNITKVTEDGFTKAFNDVDTGKADAFVLDDLLLFGERSKSTHPQDFTVTGEFLSVEPLAIMIRKNDPEFKAIVDKEMLKLINTGEINQYYKKWFESPIPPNNQNLNIPQSPLLKDNFRMPSDQVGN
jgi:ABC-type amino acid transport substrate-binding protein